MLVPKLRFQREDGTDYREWEEKTLQDVSSYITTTGTGEKSVYVGTENMRKDCSGVVLEDNNDTTVKGIQYALNDVLVSNIRPYLKKAWRADRSGICSTDVLCIRGTSGILSEYLYTLLSSDSFFEYVMQGVKGTKMPRGDKKHIMDMPVSIPCLEEQKKIADFLSTVDEVIAQSKAEVQNLEQQKKAAMQKIFSQEVRFKREDGTDYPEWEEKKLHQLVKPNDKVPVETSKYRKITIGLRLKGVSFAEMTREMADKRPFYLRKEGEIIVGKQNYFNGSIALITKEFNNTICSNAIMSFMPNDSVITFFLLSAISNDKYLKEREYMANGTGQKELSEKDFLNFSVAIPCLEEQQKIADFLSAYDEAISYAKQELDKWKELKKGLLQQMFV